MAQTRMQQPLIERENRGLTSPVLAKSVHATNSSSISDDVVHLGQELDDQAAHRDADGILYLSHQSTVAARWRHLATVVSCFSQTFELIDEHVHQT